MGGGIAEGKDDTGGGSGSTWSKVLTENRPNVLCG